MVLYQKQLLDACIKNMNSTTTTPRRPCNPLSVHLRKNVWHDRMDQIIIGRRTLNVLHLHWPPVPLRVRFQSFDPYWAEDQTAKKSRNVAFTGRSGVCESECCCARSTYQVMFHPYRTTRPWLWPRCLTRRDRHISGDHRAAQRLLM